MVSLVGKFLPPEKNSEVLANISYIMPGLDKARRQDIKTLLSKYPHMTKGKLGCTSITEHTIWLEESMQPIAQGYYKVNPQHAERTHAQVQFQLDLGLIEKWCSPWVSTVVLVPKEGGGDRFCINFRILPTTPHSSLPGHPRPGPPF
ncbi:uncharacterized protein [Macrobrachium rosenbergii]|uniref:uncharacterized protein n=1 Tax=Macrobrachium rosenbergii TaxID=79674 RepID=UPI0034D4969A